MTLVKVRAAFEKAITDKVRGEDPTVKIIYDNTSYTSSSKTTKYLSVSIDFSQSTKQNQGNSSDYYEGVIQCNVYVPKGKGTAELSRINELVIDGLTSVNASTYVDTYSCKPKIRDIVGPSVLDIPKTAHLTGSISCQFSANA
tara:strand:+ start:970 stop:1398 length:429 start_codon:yes stop_codon:yes gene_type:complete